MKRLLLCLFIASSGAAWGQTVGSADQRATLPANSDQAAPPPGGCMPIGLTASGEVVFPFQCKEFIESLRGPIGDSKTAREERPLQSEKQELRAAAPPLNQQAVSQQQPDVTTTASTAIAEPDVVQADPKQKRNTKKMRARRNQPDQAGTVSAEKPKAFLHTGLEKKKL